MTITEAHRAKRDIRYPRLREAVNKLTGSAGARLFAAALCILGAAAGTGFADHVPIAPNGILEFEGHTVLVAPLGAGFEVLAEASGMLEDVDHQFRYRSLMLGGYYRVIRNLKVGAFYLLQGGVRHDDDWVANIPGPPGWVWQDTTGRYEHVLMLDVSPRFLLDFLPGRSWVLMIKGRYVFDTFNLQHSIIARPQLTFFWLRDRDPFLDFTASFEAWFPLNYGTTVIWESYPYMSVGWHVTPSVMIELAGAYKTTIWSTSQGVLDAVPFPGTYQVAYSRWVLSTGVVFTLGR